MKNPLAKYAILISAMLFGTIPIFAALLANYLISAVQQTAGRMVFVILILLPVLWKHKLLHFNKKDIPFWIGFGLVLFLVEFLYILSVVLGTPVAVAGFLVYTQPIWTLILGRFWFKEKILHKHIVSVIIALIGVFVLLDVFHVQLQSLIGPFLALCAGLALSLWLCCCKEAGRRKYHFMAGVFWSELFGLFFALLAFAFQNLPAQVASFVWPLNSSVILLLVLFAIIPTIIGHGLFFWGITHTKASDASILVMLEPLSTAVLGMILLAQQLAWTTIIGGILILIAAYRIIKR